jgi:toxin ParE1/3/4
VRVIWTEPAILDLSSARAWIAADRPLAAAGQVVRIVEAVAILPGFTQSGLLGRHSGTRELVVAKTPFIVAYRVRGDLVEILRVLHGARRWPSRL